MPYGLQSSGFIVKPQADILSDMQTTELNQVSPSLNIQATGLTGIQNGIFSAALAELWLLAAALYNGMDPDNATNDQLTSLALITGTTRENATASVAKQCVVNVNAAFFAAAGTMFAAVPTNSAATFTNVTDVNNPGGSPTNINVDFQCTVTGPVQALAGTLTQITTSLSGWNSITNPTDAIEGSNVESDTSLRLRRNQDLSNAGSSTADAIRSAVLQKMQIGVTPGVTFDTKACSVFHNDGDVTDSNGIPPHSVEVVSYQPGITPGDSNDIALAQLILDEKAAGIGTNGTSSEVAKDSQGVSETIKFTRPTVLNPTISVDLLVKDPSSLPLNWDTQVKEVLVAYGLATYGPGATIYPRPLEASIFDPDFWAQAGSGIDLSFILDINTFTVNGGTVPVSYNFRQVPVIDSGSITVTHTP